MAGKGDRDITVNLSAEDNASKVIDDVAKKIDGLPRTPKSRSTLTPTQGL